MSDMISVVVPVYNEIGSLKPFQAALTRALERIGEAYEIVFVDDGSEDGSGEYLESLTVDPRVKLIRFRRNFGQTAALAAGFQFAAGSILITIDADLQNDPDDISAILSKLREGYDVVSCWRRDRRDPWFTRTFPSRMGNLLISWFSGVRLHDYGCTLKGYHREVLHHVRLYGEMHRFVPVYASWAGAKVAEIPVRHHPRRCGASKYGLSRTYKVALDLITLKLLGGYSTKSMYFFGGSGLLACAAGLFFAAWTFFDRYFHAVQALRNPLLLLAAFLFLMGIQFILVGLVAELLIRTWYESQDKKPYLIRRTWNCGLKTAGTQKERVYGKEYIYR